MRSKSELLKTRVLMMAAAMAIGLIVACASSKPSMLPYDEGASQ
jgi:hypothetical protein